jgi:plasmid stabilization system protein ParE
MMTYSVAYTPEAQEQPRAIYRYIAKAASPVIAQRFTDAIVDHCDRFRELPARAIRRDDTAGPAHHPLQGSSAHRFRR